MNPELPNQVRWHLFVHRRHSLVYAKSHGFSVPMPWPRWGWVYECSCGKGWAL